MDIVQRNISKSFDDYNPDTRLKEIYDKFDKKKFQLEKAKMRRIAIEDYKKNRLILKQICEDLRIKYFHYTKQREPFLKIEKYRDKNWQILLATYIVLMKFEEILYIRKGMMADNFCKFSRLQKSLISLKFENGQYAGKENNFEISPNDKKYLRAKYVLDLTMRTKGFQRLKLAKKKSRIYIGLFFQKIVDKFKFRDIFNEYTLQSNFFVLLEKS